MKLTKLKLNKIEFDKLPKADALCLHAYIESLTTIKEYKDKIKKLGKTRNLSYQILSLAKETHESYANVLVNILAELPTIKDYYKKS
jgi:hypothetical protein